MKVAEKSVLYLLTVLAVLFLFSLFGYFTEYGKIRDPIYDERDKQSSLIDRLLEEEKEVVRGEPRNKIIAGIKINVNEASAGELSLLPGLSDETAMNIVRYRNNRGSFRRYSELLRVKGIKEKRLKKILPYIEL